MEKIFPKILEPWREEEHHILLDPCWLTVGFSEIAHVVGYVGVECEIAYNHPGSLL